MGPRTSYAPGTFCWVDLATTDLDGARDFYTDLFGWDGDAEAGGSMLRLAGALVAAFSPLSAAPRASGATASWTSYVSVVDAEAAAARAVELGGAIARDAFDLADVGRVALIQDPQGATLALWQAGTHFGAERVNDVGCLCMNELVTADLDAARSFYEQLFGWTTGLVDTGPGGPTLVWVHNDGVLNGHMSVEPGPPLWRAYFHVASTTAAIHRLETLGGSVLFGPIVIPTGSFAIERDPQGAEFAVLEGATDP
jgi:predicted enzyme related to lactoylglutathione lyase